MRRFDYRITDEFDTQINYQPKVDYTGITKNHILKCGCEFITYKAESSITLRNHILNCKKNQLDGVLNLSRKKGE